MLMNNLDNNALVYLRNFILNEVEAQTVYLQNKDMKRILLTAMSALCVVITVSAQNKSDSTQIDRQDTIKTKPKGAARVFYRDFTNRHEHIFNIENGIVNFTLGYNYYYNVKPYFKIGGRFGGWIYNLSKKRQALYCPSKIMNLKLEMLLAFKIWRSINVELGVGYAEKLGLDIISGKSSPPKAPRGGFCAKCAGGIQYGLDVSLTLWKHFFLRGGVLYTHSGAGINIFYPNVGIGFQFNHK